VEKETDTAREQSNISLEIETYLGLSQFSTHLSQTRWRRSGNE
jgi:hypothetical protein